MGRTLTPPGVFLVRMLVFLTLVGFLAAILHEQLIGVVHEQSGSQRPHPRRVLFLGIIYAFRQVIRLYPEIRLVNAFRISDPGLAIAHQPMLLAPMATMLRDRTGVLSLSTASMRSIMDSIGSRLDEARDTGRYLVGLLVFLGLLGTFWGLLETIQSVGGAISALDTSGGESVLPFSTNSRTVSRLRSGAWARRSRPRCSASRARSILGFLELQASHAHNRFYNELEEWLSGITELTPGSRARRPIRRAGSSCRPCIEMQRAVEDLSARIAAMRRSRWPAGGHGAKSRCATSHAASISSSRRCAPSRRSCASGSTTRRHSRPRSRTCSKDLAQNIVRRKGK